jgi:MFS family permease
MNKIKEFLKNNKIINKIKKAYNNNKATPLPIISVFIIFILFLCDCLYLTSLSPYQSYLITEEFKLTEDKGEVGFYSGLFTTSYFVTQFFSSFFWGFVSDIIGRKVVILTGILGAVFFNFGFGVAKTFWFSLLMRFSLGLVNGNIGVYKTYLGEITDETNQAFAFAIIGVSFGLAATGKKKIKKKKFIN